MIGVTESKKSSQAPWTFDPFHYLNFYLFSWYARFTESTERVMTLRTIPIFLPGWDHDEPFVALLVTKRRLRTQHVALFFYSYHEVWRKLRLQWILKKFYGFGYGIFRLKKSRIFDYFAFVYWRLGLLRRYFHKSCLWSKQLDCTDSIGSDGSTIWLKSYWLLKRYFMIMIHPVIIYAWLYLMHNHTVTVYTSNCTYINYYLLSVKNWKFNSRVLTKIINIINKTALIGSCQELVSIFIQLISNIWYKISRTSRYDVIPGMPARIKFATNSSYINF